MLSIAQVWLEPISTFAGFVGLIVTFWLSSRKSLQTQRADTYFKLEVESSRLFEIARENHEMMLRLQDKLDVEGARAEQLDHQITWYLPQVLNLFELSIAFRKRKIFERRVFLTWVAWYYELSSYGRFPAFWEELRLHYKPDLRMVMDTGIRCGASTASASACERQFFEQCAEIFGDRRILTYYEASRPLQRRRSWWRLGRIGSNRSAKSPR